MGGGMGFISDPKTELSRDLKEWNGEEFCAGAWPMAAVRPMMMTMMNSIWRSVQFMNIIVVELL
jgi:hypothetical protein